MKLQSKFKDFFMRIFIYFFSFTFLIACREIKSNHHKHSLYPSIEQALSYSGGIAANFSLCPESPYDTIVPIAGLDPEPNEGQPHMTIEGVDAFIKTNGINSIEQLLEHFPDHYRNNFSLVEHTRATGQSNLEYPRVVLFGPDGRFLLNIGSKPDDPKYNLLDVAQLHEVSGKWEFSVFDFTGESPQLIRNDPSCIECHGDSNARPFWGGNLDWPGVFGDNIAKGPQGEALDDRHAEQMNLMKNGQGKSPRFDFLMWGSQKLKRGAKRKIANHVFGAELLMSNIAMGSATSRGTYIRLTKTFPDTYRALREELLLAYYIKKGNAYLSLEETRIYDSINAELGIKTNNLDSLLDVLGLDTKEAFSLATLAEKETSNTDWSMGKGDLYDLLMLQILDELSRDNEYVRKILENRTVEEGILGCSMTASSIADVVDFKMMHLFHLKGSARYEVNRVFYPIDIEDVYDRVFIPVSHNMIQYLKSNIETL